MVEKERRGVGRSPALLILPGCRGASLCVQSLYTQDHAEGLLGAHS